MNQPEEWTVSEFFVLFFVVQLRMLLELRVVLAGEPTQPP